MSQITFTNMNSTPVPIGQYIHFIHIYVVGLSEPEFYGDLIYKFKKLIGRNVFFCSVQKKT